MRLHFRTAWLCLAVLLTCSSFSQEPQATLSIICDEDCLWKVDSNRSGTLQKDHNTNLTVSFGRHTIEATLSDGRSWEKTIDLTDPRREIRIGFVKEAPMAPNPSEPPESDSIGGVPKFYAESRQLLVGATVWAKTDRPWPEEPKSKPGVTSKDFHIFENGVEQSLNYFRESDFPNAWAPGYWLFSPTSHGMWGFDLIDRDSRPAVTYLIGYVPRSLSPGECRTISAEVKGYSVYLSRNRYCDRQKSGALDPASTEPTPLDAKMRAFASSREHASIQVAAQAYTLRSSGVVHTGGSPSAADLPPVPSSGFQYVIEVHDVKAVATVKIAAQFSWPELHWEARRPYDLEVHVLGMIYTVNGDFVGQFSDTYRPLDLFPAWERNYKGYLDRLYSQNTSPKVDDFMIPNRFDTQVELPPGEYELRLVVSDGRKDFGRARVPFRVERFDSTRLSLSDLAFSVSFDEASTVAYHTALVAPDPLVPTPLVSKDVEFYPATTRKFKGNKPVFLYFEIYEPLLEKEKPAVYIRLKVTNLKTGLLAVNTHWMSAATWIQTGNSIIPIGVKLQTEKLKSGPYKLEVQASDSAGHETEWRQADFGIE